MTHASVLIVDDEKNILSTLSRALRVEDYDVDVAGNAEIALRKVGSKAYDLLLLDVQLPDQDGLSILRQLREQQNDVPVIMMSGHGTIETAVQATQLGAYTFLEKPIGSERLLLAIQNCLGYARLAAENEELKERAGATDELLGESPVMQALRERIALAANANANVLVTGERGTGKELVARAIHLGSKRAGGPYEKLNCAAVPAELIESELFGHEAGAFTGATKQRRGKFERAAGGTLFLDEVAELSASLQAKLLRVLQERSFHRIGGAEEIRVDIRIVAASHRDLASEVAAGRFREDLFFRLAVFEMDVPPLRARGDDVLLLARRFLAQHGGEPPPRLDDAVVALFRRHRWPGNVRELENAVQRALVVCRDGLVRLEDLPPRIREAAAAGTDGPGEEPGAPAGAGAEGAGGPLSMEELERRALVEALERCDGNVAEVVRQLGIGRTTVYRKLKKYGLR